MRRWLFAGCVLVAAGAGVGSGGWALYRHKGPLARAVDVVIPRGAFSATAVVLRDAGVVKGAWALRVFEAATIWQGPIRAGEFSFPAGVSLEKALFILRRGRPVQHLVVVPEGVTSARIGQILADAAGLSGEVAVPSEGVFLPESYAYERGTETRTILERGKADMVRLLDRVWANRAPALALQSQAALVIVASLVERETHLAAERPLVAAVFENRLRLAMRLQADPSVVYAASGGAGVLPHALRRDELDAESPYNTYMVAGLPAGPICNPGAASLEAAAHPAPSSALYFVADGSGGHVFARSLDEHLRNVARARLLAR